SDVCSSDLGFETVRLSLGQVGPHREGRLRQIERLSIVHGACNLQSIKYVEKGRHESNKKAFRRLRTKGILPRYHLAWMAKKQDHPARTAVSGGSRLGLLARTCFRRAAPGRWLTSCRAGLAPFPGSLNPQWSRSLPLHRVRLIDALLYPSLPEAARRRENGGSAPVNASPGQPALSEESSSRSMARCTSSYSARNRSSVRSISSS